LLPGTYSCLRKEFGLAAELSITALHFKSLIQKMEGFEGSHASKLHKNA
jgi:hypothetical protein